MASTRFIIIRHGETEWNADGREMGQLDSPLTAKGMIQAQQLAARLKGIEFISIYSSDLGRAVKTASIIAEGNGRKVIFDVRLRERNMGIFQGLTAEEMEQQFPKEREAYRRVGSAYVIPNGESADQRVARTVECLDELALRHLEETVVVITHGGILMGFFEYVLGLPFRSGSRFRRKNAAWNVFVREDKRWVLDTWGDVSHQVDGQTTQDS